MSDTQAEWPIELRGITESIVTTQGPNKRWNLAALGLHAPDEGADDPSDDESPVEENVTVRTWGRTRTRQNFRQRGEGYVQFTRDPVAFVDASLGVRELDTPVLDSADAWVQISVERIDAGRRGGTEWVDWRLMPEESTVNDRVVFTFNRGYAAVVEATIAASRLDVDEYDTGALLDRIQHFKRIAHRCGGPREEAAFDRLDELTEE